MGLNRSKFFRRTIDEPFGFVPYLTDSVYRDRVQRNGDRTNAGGMVVKMGEGSFWRMTTIASCITYLGSRGTMRSVTCWSCTVALSRLDAALLCGSLRRGTLRGTVWRGGCFCSR